MKRREFLVGTAAAALLPIVPNVAGSTVLTCSRTFRVDSVVFHAFGEINSDMVKQLGEALDFTLGDEHVLIRFNSPGGGAFDGLEMQRLIEVAKRRGVRVAALSTGIVGGIALLPFLACERRSIHSHCNLSFHGTRMHAYGGADAAKEAARLCLNIDRLVAKYIAAYCKMSATAVLYAMEIGLFCDAEEALSWGLVHEIQ